MYSKNCEGNALVQDLKMAGTGKDGAETSRVLILWNRDSYSSKLRNKFGESAVLCSESEARDALKAHDGQGLVVLAELDWSGHHLSDLYGIEFVKRCVRAEYQKKEPILFVSFLDVADILTEPSREIIMAVGHDVEELPTNPERWKMTLQTALPLTELQRIDVLHNLCNIAGLIGEVVHRMKGQLRTLLATEGPPARLEEVVKLGLNDVFDLLGNTSDINSTKQRILTDFRADVLEGGSDALSFLDRAGEELQSLDGRYRDESLKHARDRDQSYPWKVMILDDEPESLEPILRSFHARGIGAIVAASVSEAENAIKEDHYNEIVVAISDYRLLETHEGIVRQQRKQGYDFLFELGKQDRFTRLVALSGLGRKFLLESFRHYNTRVEVFSKDDLRTPSALNLFADRIEDLGKEVYDSLCSQPLGKGWRSLRPFYIAHRQSDEYQSNEQEISERARRYVLKISSIFKGNQEDLFLNPSLEKLDNLQSDLTAKDPYSKQRLNAFKNKLIARRIALWLYFVMDFGRSKIFAALHGTLDVEIILDEIKKELRGEGSKNGANWAAEIEQNAKSRLENRIKPLFNNLALSLSDFPLGMLVEEKRWFRYDMGIDQISERREDLDQVFCFVQVGVEHFLTSDSALTGDLIKSGVLTEHGIPNITSLREARDMLSKLATTVSAKSRQQEFRKLVRAIAGNIDSRVYHDEGTGKFRQFLEGLSESPN
jgi:hypothetical protein